MGYNLKNARNGKSISKNSKMTKFEAPDIQEEVYQHSEFLENLGISMENGEQGLALQ